MSEPTEQKKEEKTNYTSQLLIWGAVVLGFWLLYLAVLYWGHYILPIPDSLAQHSEAIGVFGDYFGALNALFAGLAFAGLIVTIHQQSADLKATKEEMRQSREEMEQQTQQFKKDYQSNLVFKRLELIKKLEEDIEFKEARGTEEGELRGSKALTEIALLLIRMVEAVFPENENNSQGVNVDQAINDTLIFSNALIYLDAWMRSFASLLEDIYTDTEGDTKRKERFYNIVFNSTHMLNLAILYSFHDTYLRCEVIEKLRIEKILDETRLYRRAINPLVRKLLHDMWDELTSPSVESLAANMCMRNEQRIVMKYMNLWRRANGWKDCILEKRRTNDQNVRNNLTLSTAELIYKTEPVRESDLDCSYTVCSGSICGSRVECDSDH